MDVVIKALNNVGVGLNKYNNIMNKFNSVDVSNDADFQRSYKDFYRLRGTNGFFREYYKLMENNKGKYIKYEDVLRHLYAVGGRIEASFSSKLVATINPNMPILDSFVMKNLGLTTPEYTKTKESRIKETIENYNMIVAWYNRNLESQYGQEMIKLFNNKFPNSNITDVKKIDFILWQIR